MQELKQIGMQQQPQPAASPVLRPGRMVLWLQAITLAWMLIEFGVASYAAVTAHSPVLLAFGSDSLIELLSGVVVRLQWISTMPLSERSAARAAGVLLFMLAFTVAAVAVASLLLRLRPKTSFVGIGITLAALIVMPILASLKRHEARRSGNTALGADAVQSAACA
jgi:divalent metal cation (Fe/Co/Zn/Cd) transporter